MADQPPKRSSRRTSKRAVDPEFEYGSASASESHGSVSEVEAMDVEEAHHHHEQHGEEALAERSQRATRVTTRRGRRARGSGSGTGSRRAASKRTRRGVEIPPEEQDPPVQVEVPTRGAVRGAVRGARGRGGRGRRGGRSRVKKGGLQLTEQQVAQLVNYQKERKKKIKDLVEKSSKTFLQNLVMLMAEIQPGLMLDIIDELSAGEAEPAPVPPPAPADDTQAPNDVEPPQGQAISRVGDPPQGQAIPRDEDPPASPRDEDPPASPRDESPPASPRDESPPASPQHEDPPASPQHEDPPASPQHQQPDWCTCGQCQEMPDPIENICCGNRAEYCISIAAEMNALILDEAVLLLQRLYRGDIFNLRAMDEPRGGRRAMAEERKRFRHTAYRQFILWQHGRLGRGNRRVVPSCCVLSIRHRYPDPQGFYVGFKAAARLN